MILWHSQLQLALKYLSTPRHCCPAVSYLSGVQVRQHNGSECDDARSSAGSLYRRDTIVKSWVLYLVTVHCPALRYLSGVRVRQRDGGGERDDARSNAGSSYRRDTIVKSWCASISFCSRDTISKSDTDDGTRIPKSLAIEFLKKNVSGLKFLVGDGIHSALFC